MEQPKRIAAQPASVILEQIPIEKFPQFALCPQCKKRILSKATDLMGYQATSGHNFIILRCEACIQGDDPRYYILKPTDLAVPLYQA